MFSTFFSPNSYYDQLEDSSRFFIVIGLLVVPYFTLKLFIAEGLAYKLTMIVFCLAGLYRISYALYKTHTRFSSVE